MSPEIRAQLLLSQEKEHELREGEGKNQAVVSCQIPKPLRWFLPSQLYTSTASGQTGTEEQSGTISSLLLLLGLDFCRRLWVASL